MPQLLLKSTIDGDYLPHLTYSTYLRNNEKQRLLPDKSETKKTPQLEYEEEENWEVIIYKIWRKSPRGEFLFGFE
jgi:hypothetical protein